MTFAERWSAEERLRGIVVRLPAAEAEVAAAAGLDFVAVDLVAGPSDEVSFSGLARAAKSAQLGLVAIAASSAQRLTVLGADVVINHGDGALRVVDDLDGVGAGTPRVALDVSAHLRRVLTALAGTTQAPAVSLVFLPGMLGSAGLFSDVASQLDAGINCRSLRIDLDESVADAAESVLAAAPPRFALAGHSLGGIVALEVWRRDPQRITRLALLNTSARPPTDAQLAAWAVLGERTEAGEFDAVVAEQSVLNVGAAGAARPELIARWVELAGAVGPEGFLRQLSMQASRPDGRPSLGAIDVPTLVLTGATDTVCPAHLQAELATTIPRVRHVTIEGAGHMSPLDHPAEVAAALREWLEAT